MSPDLKEVNKYDNWFSIDHLKDDLKSRSVRGGFSTVTGQVFSFVLNTLSTVVMARLLLPADFGLVAMVTAVTGFVTIFKDLGLSSAIMQRSEINQKQVSAVFWINVLISFGVGLLVACITPFMVSFYNEPRLASITLVFALSIFITGLSIQHNALMQRQMRFFSLSLIQLGSTLLSLIIGIMLAVLGCGYWSIVAISVSSPLISSVALWIACDWRPSFYKRDNVSSFLKFGAGIAGFDLINYFSRNADNVLIGKYIGSVALGLYSKAYQLLMLPINQLKNPLTSVALPVLSSLQNDPAKYTSFYTRYLFVLAFFSMPIVMFMGIFAEEIIRIILGDKWTGAAYIFQLLAITGFIQPIASTQGLVLITTGRTNRYFYLGVFNAFFTVLGFIIGIKWGIAGVAISQAIVLYCLFFPLLYLNFHRSPIRPKAFLTQIVLPFVFSLISGTAMYLMKIQMQSLNIIIMVFLGFLSGLIVYLLLWMVSVHGRNKLKELAEIFTLLLKKKSAADI